MRSGSVCASEKSIVPAVELPAVTSAPISTKRRGAGAGEGRGDFFKALLGLEVFQVGLLGLVCRFVRVKFLLAHDFLCEQIRLALEVQFGDVLVGLGLAELRVQV